MVRGEVPAARVVVLRGNAAHPTTYYRRPKVSQQPVQMRPATHHQRTGWNPHPEPYWQHWGHGYPERHQSHPPQQHRDERYHGRDRWQSHYPPRPFAVQAPDQRPWRPQAYGPARPPRYAPYVPRAQWRGSERHLPRGRPNDVLECGMTIDQVYKLMQRDLTTDDYELLLLLDETNVKVVNKDARVKPADGTDKVCSVCISGFDDGDAAVKLDCCEAVFHDECIRKWLGEYKNRCPQCRHEHEQPQ